MSGTLCGGKLAAQTTKRRHGKDFYRRVGAIGGSKGHTGGFYANRDLASIAGALGGRISRYGANKISEKERRQIREAYEELLAVHNRARH